MSALVRIPFHGDHLEAVGAEDGPWVPVRRVCGALALDPDSQRQKLAEKEWATTVLKTVVAEDGKNRELFCIHLDALPMWLATIEASRVAPEARPKLIAYQREAARVLRDHFFGPRTGPAPLRMDILRHVETALGQGDDRTAKVLVTALGRLLTPAPAPTPRRGRPPGRPLPTPGEARPPKPADPWIPTVRGWVEGRPSVTCADVLECALNIPRAKQEQVHLNRVGAILGGLGWARERYQVNGERTRRYRAPAAKPAPSPSPPPAEPTPPPSRPPRPVDPWLPAVLAFIDGRSSVSMQDIFTHALGIPPEKQRQHFVNRLGVIMRELGWWRGRKMVKGDQERVYFPSPSAATSTTAPAAPPADDNAAKPEQGKLLEV